MSSQIKKRKPNFGEGEIMNFLKILETRRTLINGESNLFGEALANAWNEVADEFSATAVIPRTGEELRNKFIDLKSRTKKKLTEIKNHQKRTGGAPPLQLKPYEELIVQLAGSNAMHGLNYHVDSLSEVPILTVDTITTDTVVLSEAVTNSEVVNVEASDGEPSIGNINRASTCRSSRLKRSRSEVDDLDRRMLEIADSNLRVQKLRLNETKVTNELLRGIFGKLGCQCQNKPC